MSYDEIIEDVWKIELDILNCIVKICDKHSLEYMLGFGTLIGAVRHQGFIPWDDDIDIMMPRRDYQRFLQFAIDELPSDYYLQCGATDPTFIRSFAKVRKNNTIFLEECDSHQIGKHHGIFVDIFPLDYASNNRMLQKLRREIVCKLDTMKQAKQGYFALGIVKMGLCRIIPLRVLHKIQLAVLMMGNNREKYTVFMTPYGIDKVTFSIQELLPTKMLSFENNKYKCPNDYHAVLSRIYGDYMQLPPVEKRVAHSPIRICLDTRKISMEDG